MAEGSLRAAITRRIGELETEAVNFEQAAASLRVRCERLKQLRVQVIDNPDQETRINAIFAEVKDVL